MKFNVTEVEFDFDEFGDGNPEWQLTFDEEIEIRDLALGVWEADDEDEIEWLNIVREKVNNIMLSNIPD